VERRHGVPDLDRSLKYEIAPAAEITLHSTGRDPDNRGNAGENEPEQHGYAEAIDQPRHHVEALGVGAERVVFEVPTARKALLLPHGGTLFLGEEPGWLRRRRRRQVEIVGVVGVADHGPHHEAARVGDKLLQIGIAIVSRSLELAAERGLGIGAEDREKIAAVV